MAITKIKPITTTLDKAIDYICNPSKTKHNHQTVDELESNRKPKAELLRQEGKVYCLTL